MKPLPVPSLDATIERALTSIEAVAEPKTLAEWRRAAAAFRDGDGARRQARLSAFAAERAAEGSSWLAERWLDGYLRAREPLTAVSNVAFETVFDTPENGLDRVARIVAAAAEVHLRQAAGELGARTDARGNVLSPAQWRVLSGGIRVPRQGRDDIVDGCEEVSNREVVVFHRGRAFAVPVTDAAGDALDPAELRVVLSTVVAAVGDTAGGFTALSYLGSGDVRLRQLVADPDNEETHRRLAQALFCVHLADEAENQPDGVADVDRPGAAGHASSGPEGDRAATQAGRQRVAAQAARLRAAAFGPGRTWVYKPLTYEFDLSSDFSALLVEHSCVDGATVVQLVADVQDASARQDRDALARQNREESADGAL